jgi:hypothetical protein
VNGDRSTGKYIEIWSSWFDVGEIYEKDGGRRLFSGIYYYKDGTEEEYESTD